MSKFWGLVISCMAAAGCHSGSGHTSGSSGTTLSNGAYNVSGTISGVDSGLAVLYYMKNGVPSQDTAPLSAGHFTFTGRTDQPLFASLTLAELQGKPMSFFLEPNIGVTINGAAGSLDLSMVTGGPVETEYLHFADSTRSFDNRRQLLDSLSEAVEGDKAAADSLAKEYDVLLSQKQTLIKQYISKHPASYVSALEMEDMYGDDSDPNVPEFDSAYHALDTVIRESPVGKQLAGMLTTAKRMAIGQPAPDFTANDPEGRRVMLSAYAKGKVVLVDFWASWCAPCRAENPNVVRTYQLYQPKGFTVLGVSLDDNKEPWIKAIQKDQLDWGQVSDLRGWSGDISALYGIHAIPMNFLLDRNGRIVAKGLRGDALQQMIMTVFRRGS